MVESQPVPCTWAAPSPHHRASPFANPFTVKEHGRAGAMELYRQYLRDHPELVIRARAELAGQDLACWCRPDEDCHADILLAVATGEDPDGRRHVEQISAAPPAHVLSIA